jgi:quercetin dioxygenase-like cupin family protein
MGLTAARFDEMKWQPGVHPHENKKAAFAGSVVLVKFAPGFADPNWCERSHAMYVVEGVIALELEGRVETFSSGQAAVLDRGTRHRASNPASEPAVLFIVSDFS